MDSEAVRTRNRRYALAYRERLRARMGDVEYRRMISAKVRRRRQIKRARIDVPIVVPPSSSVQ